MNASITLQVIGGETTCGPLVKFEAAVDDSNDQEGVGTVVGAAVQGVGICRQLLAIAYAARYIGEGHCEECRVFEEAAETYIKYWAEIDKDMHKEMT